MDELRAKMDAAPSYGVNARHLLMDAARALAEEEMAEGKKPGRGGRAGGGWGG
jgi:hypothetical protein